MSHETIHYSTGEVALVGDQVINDVWASVVEDVIDSEERMAFWSVDEPGLMLKCDEAGLVFEPCSSGVWDSIVLKARAP